MNNGLLNEYQNKLQHLKGKKKIGISWHTSNPKNGFKRNIELKDLLSVFKNIDVDVISLQYNEDMQEISDAEQHNDIKINTFSELDKFNDIEGLSALISSCDEVITIDNTTTHLAGALGVKTCLLIPALSDWRWGLEEDQSLWYPSIQLFRKKDNQCWIEVLNELRIQLFGIKS